MRDLERYSRNVRNENRATITTHRNAPKRNEGVNGDIRITTTVEGGVKLFSKYNGEWYSAPLSKYIIKEKNEDKRTIDAMSSLGTSGYQEFDSGLIIQWGKVTSDSTVTFSKEFPKECFNVVLGKATTAEAYGRVESISTTGFVYSATLVAGDDSYWQAIGY